MKAADRKRALTAVRIYRRAGGTPQVTAIAPIAKRLKVEPDSAAVILNIGLLIEQCEAYRLTDNEMLVMTALARVEARRVALGHAVAKANQVDFAAGKRSGWSYSVSKKRLLLGDLGFIIHTPAGHIWLTAAGWAFVWATGLILKNWKVPT